MRYILNVVVSWLVTILPIYIPTVHAQFETKSTPETAINLADFLLPQAPILSEIQSGKSHQIEQEEAETIRVNAAKTAQNAQIKQKKIEQYDSSAIKLEAREIIRFYWDSDDEWGAFERIINVESGWNPNALNKTSGACGLPQALPCSKIKDKSTSGQIHWAIEYIIERYRTPSDAWTFWQKNYWY